MVDFDVKSQNKDRRKRTELSGEFLGPGPAAITSYILRTGVIHTSPR